MAFFIKNEKKNLIIKKDLIIPILIRENVIYIVFEEGREKEK